MKVKQSLGQALRVPEGWGSQTVHKGSKLVSPMHRPSLLSRKYCWYWFLLEAGATGRIMSVKNSSDANGKRIRDLPVCSAVPQPNTPLRANNYIRVHSSHVNYMENQFHLITIQNKEQRSFCCMLLRYAAKVYITVSCCIFYNAANLLWHFVE
jgi:hypothetical protein